MTKKPSKRTNIKAGGAPEKTPYEILEVQESDSVEEIRKAYLRKVRLFTPERDPEAFKEIRKAYGLLKDSIKRRELDLSLFKAQSGIDIGIEANFDFAVMFQERIFRLLLISSDFYVKNFRRNFHSIEKTIKHLQ